MRRAEVLNEIAGVIAEIRLAHPVRVVVDGRDGAGKSVLADELVGPLQSRGREVIRASVDGFHNPRALRYAQGRSSPEGYFLDSFNYDAFREVLLVPLGPDGCRQYRTAVFDWRTDSPVISPLRRAADDAVLVVDGIFMLRPELINYWDFRIFVDVTIEIGLMRCAMRDGSSSDSLAEENRRYIGGQKMYFEECNPKALADVLVDNNNFVIPKLIWNHRTFG